MIVSSIQVQEQNKVFLTLAPVLEEFWGASQQVSNLSVSTSLSLYISKMQIFERDFKNK